MLKSFEELSSGSLDYQSFENSRIQAQEKSKKGMMMGGIIGGAIVIIGIILAVISNPGLGVTLVIVGLIFFGVYWGISNSNAKAALKSKILGDMLKAIDPTFVYSKGDREFGPHFRSSGFVKSTSGSNIDDVFKGVCNGFNFGLGEIRVTRKQGKNSTVTVYHGPFAYIKTSNTYSYTSIIPDYMEKSLGGLGKVLQKADLSRLNQKNIRIDDDPNFEQMFAVWTKDEAQARSMLTPQLRQYLMGIGSIGRVYLGWRDSCIYFGIDNRRDLFELKLKNPITDSVVRNFYNDFAMYFSYIENLINIMLTGGNANSYSYNNQSTIPPSPQGNDGPPPPPPPKF